MKKTFKLLVSFLFVFLFIGMVKAQSLGIDSISIRLEKEVNYPGDQSYVRYEVEGEEEDKTCTVSVTGNNSTRTEIRQTQYGDVLVVGTNETASSLTVTVTSNADSTVSESLVVNLNTPTIINEVNFTYDTSHVPFMSTATSNQFLDWMIHNYGTSTENLEVENNGNVTLQYMDEGRIIYMPGDDEELGVEKEYVILFNVHGINTSYTFPLSVRELTYNSKVPVTTLDGLTVKVNNVVRNDVYICYSESWKDLMVYVPLGNAPGSHHVEFETNGGSEVAGMNVIDGYTLELPEDPTKEGYLFHGWYTDDKLTEQFYSHTPVTDELTLYAKWDKIITEIHATVDIPVAGEHPTAPVPESGAKYTVDSYYWYLYETPYPHLESTDTFEEGKVYSLRVYLEPNDGYAFEYGIEDYYINGVKTSCYGSAGSRELTFDLYNITFNSNGGSDVEGQVLYKSAKITKPENPTKEGLFFGGWYADSALTEKYDFNTPVTRNTTLFAKWVSSASVPVVKLTANNNAVGLSWDEDDAAVKYIIYRSNDKKKWTTLKTVTINSYIDRSLTYNKAYYYTVRACDANACSSYSNIVGKKILPNKVNLTIKSASTTNIRLSWGRVTTNGYEVYRSTNKKTWSKVATINKNTTVDWNNTKLKANTGYYYRVRAYKVVGRSKVYGPWSDIVGTKTAPVAPAVTLSIREFDQVNITMGNVKGATHYQIYRSFDNKTYELLHDLPGPGTMADGLFEFGQAIYYKVRVCNNFGSCSAFTARGIRQSAKTPNFSLTNPKTKVLTITVGSVDKADGYEVYRSTNKTKGYKLVRTIPSDGALTFNNSSVKGYTYYYRVRSYVLVDGKKVYSPFSGIKYVKSK